MKGWAKTDRLQTVKADLREKELKYGTEEDRSWWSRASKSYFQSDSEDDEHTPWRPNLQCDQTRRPSNQARKPKTSSSSPNSAAFARTTPIIKLWLHSDDRVLVCFNIIALPSNKHMAESSACQVVLAAGGVSRITFGPNYWHTHTVLTTTVSLSLV